MEAALGLGTEGPSAPHAHGGVDLNIDDIGDMEDELEDEDDLHWVLGFPEPALQACDMLRHAFPS